MSPAELRDVVRHAIEEHAYRRAATLLAQLLREQPTSSTASYVVSRFAEIRPHLELVPCRVAVLRSFTLEPVIPFLQARCFAAGIDATLLVGGFNTYAQDLLDPASPLYRFDPDIVILAVRTPDVAPALWEQFAGLATEEVHRVVEQIPAEVRLWIETFRARSRAHLVIHGLELPAYAAVGVLDSQQAFGQMEAIHGVNRRLQQLTREYPGAYLLDYDALVARHGRLRWHDGHKWQTIRMPIAAEGLSQLADEYMRFIRPLTGKVCKALAVDLDNTLWGGVVGEDGLQGIQLGPDYPGTAYRDCQRAILDLYHRGVILAICSRNNADDGLEVLATHPHMLLRPEHFAAVRINWDDKVENLRRIADELNIGLHSLAFLDDSPAEREAVRDQLPDVAVIDLPADPTLYAQALRDSPLFERLTLSDEDKARGRYYAEQRQRSELRCGTRSLEEFYVSLRMKAEVKTADSSALARVAQLTQKTNQFNVTTHRRTEQELVELTRDPRVHVLTLRLADRFGESGLVGVSMWRRHGDCGEIDTFLLSCRAIGRSVETALLACLADEARREGVVRLVGRYRPTKKNAIARDFYARHGFSLIAENADGALWEFDLIRHEITIPPWIECHHTASVRDNDDRQRVAAGLPDRG